MDRSPLSARVRPAKRIGALLVSLVSAILLGQQPSTAGVNNTGRWASSPPWDWEHVPVHMILLPGDATHHSRLLWWQDHGGSSFLGGMWGWNPGLNLGCAEAASEGFAEIETGTAGTTYDMFCAGHAQMEDKRVIILGGTESGEIGVRQAVVFDPDATGNKWQTVTDMQEPRWYPTVTRLPSGKLTVTSGSKYAFMHLYGGTPTGTANPPDGSLRRIGLPKSGEWHAPVDAMPAGTNLTVYGWPAQVTQAQFAWAETFNGSPTSFGRTRRRALLFGGDQLEGSEWISQHETRLFEGTDSRGAADEGYRWDKRQPSNVDADLLPRAGHVAVSCPPPTSGYPGFEPGWIVFGGRRRVSGPSTTYLNDVWMLAQDTTSANPSPIEYKWRKAGTDFTILNPELAPSTKRYGAAGVYDPLYRRVLIYGGSEDGLSPVASDSVYVLTVSVTTDTLTWSRILPSAPTGARPRPRFGHGMLFDNMGRRRIHVSNTDDHYFRGLLFGGRTASHADSLSNQLWSLWIDPATAGNLEWRLVEYDGSTAPAGRAFSVFIKDDYCDRLVAFGGDVTGTADKRPWSIPLPLMGGHHATNGYELADEPASGSATFKWSPAPSQFGAAGEADVSLSGAAALLSSKPTFARHTERYGADASGPTTLTNAVLRQEWYPFNFVLPDGSLFTCGPTLPPADSSYRLSNPEGDVAWQLHPPGAASKIGFHPGSGAMYRPGRILVAGSGDLHAYAPGSTESRWIALDSTNATWNASINAMRSRRSNYNLVIVPNGQTMAVGGTELVNRNDLPSKRPEFWDPLAFDSDSGRYGRWYDTVSGESLATQTYARGYHSTALLLPDGRILSAGGNDDPAGDHFAEIYCPPYLFTSIGNPASRPMFSTVPSEVAYGQTMRVCATHNGTTEQLTACLIAPAATTHGFDQNQRYIPLTVTHVCGSTYDVSTPANANIAPPGYYMFFILNNRGVPAVARWLKVRGGTPPTLPTCSDNCGGGCPMVDTRTAEGWQHENTVLARSASGEPAFDAYRLKATPEVKDGRLTLRLRENEQEVTTLDEVRLLVVDHDPGATVIGTGESAVTGARTPAFRATTSRGEDITALLSGDPGGTGWQGSPGDTVLIEFDPPRSGQFGATGTQDGGGASGAGGDKEVELRWDPDGAGGRSAMQGTATPAAATDAQWLDLTGIRIQVPDGSGGWQDLHRWYPREQPDDAYFPGLTHSRARLVFVGRHRLNFFGRMRPSAVNVTSSVLVPISATHSRLGETRTEVTAGGSTAQLAPGDTVTMEFAVPPPAEGKVRDYVLVMNGVYTSDVGQARLSPRGPGLPKQFALMQNVPNPFAATTAIEFQLPRASRVTLEVFDLLGRRVKTLTDASWSAGVHRLEWDRRTNSGKLLRSGVYLYRMTADGFRAQRKLVIGGR